MPLNYGIFSFRKFGKNPGQSWQKELPGCLHTLLVLRKPLRMMGIAGSKGSSWQIWGLNFKSGQQATEGGGMKVKHERVVPCLGVVIVG